MSAKAPREPLAPDLRIGQLVDLTRQPLRFGFGGGDYRTKARQDQHVLGPASLGSRQLFQVGIKVLRGGFRHMGGEHRIGMPSRELAAGIGRSCLDQHRPSLRTARDVERPRDGIEIAAVLDRPDAVWLCVKTGGAIVDHGVGRPTVPEVFHHLHELFTAGIAVGMADLAAAAVVLRRGGEPRRHDIPGGAALADVIDRRELASQVERLRIRGRGGCDQSDPLCHHRDRRQHGDRLEPGTRRLRNVPAERQLIREKDRIEQRRLRALRQILIVVDIGQCQRRRGGVAPRRLVVATAVDEQVKV